MGVKILAFHPEHSQSDETLQFFTLKWGKKEYSSMACFKRRATAVLSWLDCSSTVAPLLHNLVSDVKFNSVE